MKKKIWSACTKKRYLLVNYIFSISIVISDEMTITAIPKEFITKNNHLVPNSDYIYIFSFLIVVSNETTIKVVPKQRKWLLLWNENHRLIQNNDYIFIFSFYIHTFLNYFTIETSLLFVVRQTTCSFLHTITYT